MKLDVFEPAMCCSTGVCGTEVDEKLVRFSADAAWFREQGGKIERHNLSQQPMDFVEHAVVSAFLERSGEAGLPLILIDGEIALAGRYPDRRELARWLGVEADPAASGATRSCCCQGAC